MKHFRRRNAQALYDQHYGPNMTPMVDVVMVILIFFMASTAFLGPEWFLKTHLPRAGAHARGTLADAGEPAGSDGRRAQRPDHGPAGHENRRGRQARLARQRR